MNAHLLTDALISEVATERSGNRQVADLRLEDIPAKATQEQPAPMLPCPWCGAPVVRIKRGGYVKEFCSKAHKTDYKNALSKLSVAHARILRTPGALKTWSLYGGTPWRGANSVSEAPEKE